MHNVIHVLLQQVPNINPNSSTSIDFGRVAEQALLALLWAIVGAIVFSVIIALAMRVFSILTPGLDEMAELRKGNIAVGLVGAGFVLTVSVVVIAILVHP
ncbi:MAG: hypothetical protein DLM69_00775 [Candidatus Chloroheliales bacterium]|nr:MAG: hypothetical protein DLM69_00775 [Chloroflexota bacterium]